jgi:hypothetical protein
MLRAVICCVLLAATAAVADPPPPWPWAPLEETPDSVRQDAHITYGVTPDADGNRGAIWGVFPVLNEVQEIDETHVAYYTPLSTDPEDPNTGTWVPLDDEPGDVAMVHTGFTFQWGEAPYVIGADPEDNDGTLYWYPLDEEVWLSDDIEDTEGNELFDLGPGACIAYAPNLLQSATNQIAGWIFILPGDVTSHRDDFWRFAIDPTTHTAVAGLFPPSGSTIADQTPEFQWVPGSGNQYRLQVSTDNLFSTTLIDVVVYAAEYQTTSKFANDTLYWRVGTPDGLNWGATHDFVLQGGFVQLTDIPENVTEGAAMAYMQNDQIWGGVPSILAFVGGDDEEVRSFYRWPITPVPGAWATLASVPEGHYEYPGTSLTTPDPVGGHGWFAAAVFGRSVSGVDRPWGYNAVNNSWFEYDHDAFDPLPDPIGPGAGFVMGPAPFCYLTPGARYVTHRGTKLFYAIDPEHRKHKKHTGGAQSGEVYAGSMRAQVIASNNGVTVEYQLPAATRVRATLHDAIGRQVGVLDIGAQESGTHRLSWSQVRGGRGLASGAYFVLLDMGAEKATLKAVIR